uniref:Apoptosis regulator Bcl-2 family BH4 domain-containing protein n=1 Tax=Mola mola TaxID=94237 RepID=A0A3Q3X971_MOLML
MAKEYNRDLVEIYLCHKLSKCGYVWRSDDVRDENATNNGSIVAPPATLAQRCREPRAAIHRVLREAGDELERLYAPDFTEMSRQLYLTSSTAQGRFAEVIDELFRDGVNWGRIIAFFEFGGAVCAECASKEEMSPQVDNIAEWMTEYLNGPLNSWIQDNGGWDAFVELYDRQRDSVLSCSWPSFKTVFGMAALGAASLTIGAYLAQK